MHDKLKIDVFLLYAASAAIHMLHETSFFVSKNVFDFTIDLDDEFDFTIDLDDEFDFTIDLDDELVLH